MKDNQYIAWESKRTEGMLKFICINGILSFGLIMCIVMGYFNGTFNEGVEINSVINHVVTWLISGLAYGFIMWFFSEWRYKKEYQLRHGNDS
ncbi:hypothetical protein [Photobacterium chitinilyticum]|uniref:Uncharacterized protein n=1 Tax=Photobacterium chitinilyticum TaxID=2485123 RepID=A0A444JI25_9GAMM|nr:hypothetical protein [Photobacterium chitinilyticum]RWX52743.1 hypothetical protein EDI28_25680 [Photobacterium chitinilyticum]